MAAKYYRVESNLDFDGKRHSPGAIVLMNKESAASLVKLGVLSEHDADANKVNKAPGGNVDFVENGSTETALSKAIDNLKTTNGELENALACAKKTIATMQTEVKAVSHDNETLSIELLAAKDRIKALETDLENAETHIRAIKLAPEAKSTEKPKGKKS